MLRALKNALRLVLTSADKPSQVAAGSAEPAANVENFFQLGNAAVQLEDFETAAEHYARYVDHNPESPSGYIGLGFAMVELGRWADAVKVLSQAVALAPQNADGFFMLGRAYLQQNDSHAAEQAWARAHKLAPTLEPLYAEYCYLLFKNGKFSDALALAEDGVTRFPDNSDLRFYFGNLLAEQGDFAAAAVEYRTAISLGNESPGLFSSFGNALIQTGDHEGAIEALAKAQALAPCSASTASNYLLAIQYESTLTKAEKYAAARLFAERFERPLMSQWGNYRRAVVDPGPKLRIGYVSGDFRSHALAFFFEPIIALHDKSRFEVFCYYTHPIFDQVSLRIKTLADHWLDCHGMPDDILATRVREDEIDVLVDLSGHTGQNRLLTFARKPAPVQMTWLGYQATTGLRAMDYRITDEALDPTGTSERFHSETLIRLTSSGTFSPSQDSPPVNALPALGGKPFTFGCLNNPSKITSEVISVWARILNGNLDARLMIGNATAALSEHLSTQFEHCGVDPRRLVFVPKVSLDDYFALHHQIDLALDTFPYNGGTTTFHSLWMGVPVVVLDGDSTLSKVGASVMHGMGFGQFCAITADGYVERALYFSRHLAELSAVRHSLRDAMGQITQQRAVQVTRSLEDAMQSCWQEYCLNAQSHST